MTSRLELHEILCSILGSRNVFFQQPESVKIEYPAIVYSLSNIDTNFADNTLYLYNKKYSVTLIDKNPDSDFIIDLLALPNCKFDRNYKRDNINHNTFILYY